PPGWTRSAPYPTNRCAHSRRPSSLFGGCSQGSATGDYVNLEDAQLEQAPAVVPPVLLGVRRPFGLRASGRSADGTILAEPAPPAYIRWARERIDEGRASAGRTDRHCITVFVK